MKKISSLIAVLIIALSVRAQTSDSVHIVNSTTCTVYFRMIMSQPQPIGVPKCQVGPTSPLIAVPPLTTVNFNTMTIPGGMPPPAGMEIVFLGAIIFAGPNTACANPIQSLSDYPCMSYPHNSFGYEARDATCAYCATIAATFTGGAVNILTFLP